MSILARCSVERCQRTLKSRGMCTAHYQRFTKGEDLMYPPLKPYTARATSRGNWMCAISTCVRSSIPSAPLCKQHAATCYRFNLTVIQLDMTLIRGCQICGSKERLHVDHDHSCCSNSGESCGKCVRGALCSNCNTAIGLLGDDVGLLSSAIIYLLGNGIEWIKR